MCAPSSTNNRMQAGQRLQLQARAGPDLACSSIAQSRRAALQERHLYAYFCLCVSEATSACHRAECRALWHRSFACLHRSHVPGTLASLVGLWPLFRLSECSSRVALPPVVALGVHPFWERRAFGLHGPGGSMVWCSASQLAQLAGWQRGFQLLQLQRFLALCFCRSRVSPRPPRARGMCYPLPHARVVFAA